MQLNPCAAATAILPCPPGTPVAAPRLLRRGQPSRVAARRLPLPLLAAHGGQGAPHHAAGDGTRSQQDSPVPDGRKRWPRRAAAARVAPQRPRLRRHNMEGTRGCRLSIFQTTPWPACLYGALQERQGRRAAQHRGQGQGAADATAQQRAFGVRPCFGVDVAAGRCGAAQNICTVSCSGMRHSGHLPSACAAGRQRVQMHMWPHGTHSTRLRGGEEAGGQPAWRHELECISQAAPHTAGEVCWQAGARRPGRCAQERAARKPCPSGRPSSAATSGRAGTA